MKSGLIISAMIVSATYCLGNPITFPGGTETVMAISSTGTSFVYTGTLTQSDTLAFTANNVSCLQTAAYCVNAAGVVTVAGTTGVGGTSTFSGTFNGTTAAWNFGALLIEISGEGTEQIFAANATNGLGSSTPPQSLSLASTSLVSLGFGNFSVTNPTITFVVADNFYPDNMGEFVLKQSSSSVVPEPSTGLLLLAASGLGLFVRGAKKNWKR